MTRDVPNFEIYWDIDDCERVQNVIERGMYWANGPEILEFEEQIKDFVGTKFALTFANGTVALHAILLSYGLCQHDEIIVPSFSFIATANAPLFVGATPIFAEIESDTFGLDPEDVRRKVTNKTKAILPIHYAGCPCKIHELKEIAEENNLLLIEDAAEAFGAKVGQENVGSIGDAGVLSFCQNKIITTGEGGAVVTDSKEIFEKLKLIRSHGRVESGDYFNSADLMEYIQLGYNFRLPTMNAALGIAQMHKIDKIIRMRRECAHYLTKKMGDLQMVQVLKTPPNYYNVYQMYTVSVNPTVRDALLKYLNDQGIMAKINFQPIHLSKFFSESFGYRKGDLPRTETISQSVLSLPMYPHIPRDVLDYVSDQIHEFFD